MVAMKKRGLFGSMMQPDEELGGIWGATLSKQQPMQAPMQPEQEKPAGFWQGGEKFGWRDGVAGALAALGDAFANEAGMPTGAVQNLTGGRTLAIKGAQEAAAKAAELQQRQAALDAAGVPREKQPIILSGDAKYADFQPANNDTVADYNFWKSVLSPDDFQKWQQNKIDPPQYRQGPDGQFYRINPSQQQPSTLGSTLPPGWKVEGGPTQPASGGFRPRR